LHDSNEVKRKQHMQWKFIIYDLIY
jgi:hypothetical protein